jgi:hypothetical protein
MSDILTYYYPQLDEVPSTNVADARASLQAAYQRVFPDLDTRPNSVFGDLWLTPAAMHLAALDIAISRYKSDLNLENVAAGTIWDCDFVDAYLRNFSTVQDGSVLSYGVLRLVFDAPDTLTVDRQLILTPDSEGEYRFRLVEEGHLDILAPGTARDAGANQVVLVEASGGEYWVDVPVQGSYTSDDPPVAGAEFTTSDPVDGLVSATSLHDFSDGRPDERLKNVAKLTRETFYSATPVTKGGVRSFLRRQFPDMLGCSPVTNGDADMLRTDASALDIYPRSPITLDDSMVVTAALDDVTKTFYVKLALPAVPIIIDSITWAGDETLALDPASVRLYLKSSDSVKAPLCSCAYSGYQELYMLIDLPYENDTDTDFSDALITTTIVDGTEYADFNIVYRQDPGFFAMSELLTAEDTLPIGVDTLVRMPVVAYFDSLHVKYRRAAGTSVNLAQARTEILEYVNSVMYPDLFSEARIVDSMFYAGAKDVQDITVDVRVLLASADYVLTPNVYGGPEPEDGIATFEAAGTAIPSQNWIVVEDLKNYVEYPALNTSVSPENIRYLLDTANLTFEEVS